MLLLRKTFADSNELDLYLREIYNKGWKIISVVTIPNRISFDRISNYFYVYYEEVKDGSDVKP